LSGKTCDKIAKLGLEMGFHHFIKAMVLSFIKEKGAALKNVPGTAALSAVIAASFAVYLYGCGKAPAQLPVVSPEAGRTAAGCASQFQQPPAVITGLSYALNGAFIDVTWNALAGTDGYFVTYGDFLSCGTDVPSPMTELVWVPKISILRDNTKSYTLNVRVVARNDPTALSSTLNIKVPWIPFVPQGP
jgi:hypothetical protein